MIAGRHHRGPADQPTRFQRCRTKGWRVPHERGTYRMVTRPGRWGNPFRIGEPARVFIPDGGAGQQTLRVDLVRDARHAVALYAQLLLCSPWLRAQARAQLAGFHLGCFCRPGQPCHGDLLLKLANEPEHAGHAILVSYFGVSA